MTRSKSLACAALAALLCACAGNLPKDSAPTPPARDWLAQIEREAAAATSAVDVVPLPDPEVDDLRRRAAIALTEGRHAVAAEQLRAAIALRPGDPSLWQALAEVAIASRQWVQAETHARKSYDLGPQVGALCIRNWFTMLAARIERGDAPGAAAARAQVQACIVAEPARF